VCYHEIVTLRSRAGEYSVEERRMTLVGPLIGRLKDALRSRSHRGLMGDLRASEVRADAAQARESFLRQAQEVARLGTWVSGPADEDRLEWSDQSYRIFGLTRGNFDGRGRPGARG
jgi:hypothetical protein